MIAGLKRHWILVLLAVSWAVVCTSQPAAAQDRIVCVDGAVAGPGSGVCWDDPYKSLQSALGAALPGDEIWVAGGVYTPGSAVTETLRIPPGVALYGGFGATETLRTQRNWAANVTVLSGDIERNDRTTNRGVVTSTAQIVGANAYHVLSIDGSSQPVTGSTRLDGFTITAGSATDALESSGGGLLCVAAGGGACSPTLTNLVFSGNSAHYGGGLYAAASGAGSSGSPALSNAVFSGNSALASGGGLYVRGESGGGASPSLVQVTFSRNTAVASGGALYSAASSGGASSPALANAILWGNTAPAGSQLYNDNSLPTLNYSLVQGGDGGLGGSATNAFSAGAGNIAADPRFADPVPGNLLLLPGSPAIDAGSAAGLGAGAPATDARGLPRPVNGLPDMGAYESQGFYLAITAGDAQATDLNSPFAQPLRVILRSNAGDPVGSGGVVTFTPPLAGPGLSVTAPFTAAWSTGNATTATVTANGLWGSYVVTVTAQHVNDLIVFNLSNGCPHGIVYVNRTATGNGHGDTWANAFPKLQEALRLVGACRTYNEMWVAQGVYTPGVTVSSTFTLSAGVAVYGGFTGVETQRSQRNWQANLTILSGDIDGNDLTDASGVVTATTGVTGSNAYHVVWVDGVSLPVTGTALLDGFIITAGNARGAGSPHIQGGGLYCNGQGENKECSPSLTNLLFSGNGAASHGGAVYNNARLYGLSSPLLTNVTFRGNRSGSDGGAIYNYALAGTSNPTIVGGTFVDNAAGSDGGAIYNYGLAGSSSPTITNSVFTGNSAGSTGGAIHNNGLAGLSAPRLENVILRNNTANLGGAIFNYGFAGKVTPVLVNTVISGGRARRGGAIYNDGRYDGFANPILVHVTLSDNIAAESGGAIYSAAISGTSQITLANTILWGNSAPAGAQLYNDYGLPAIDYSIVQGGSSGLAGNSGTGAFSAGAGNSAADPHLFAAANGNALLLPGSAAIDAGAAGGLPVAIPPLDLRGLPRPVNGPPDMGANESQGFQLAITGGNGQTADVYSALQPLALSVTSSSGEPTGPGGSLDFTPPAAGPGLSVVTPFTVSANAGGAAAANVLANGVAGAYNVAVSARGVVTPVSFALTNQYTLTVATDVLPLAGGAAAGGGRIRYGDPVTLTATANAGYVFAGWSEGGVLLSSAAVYSFPVTGNRLLTANFSPVGPPVQVTVSADPAAGGVVSGGGWVNSGAVVTVTAAANAGYAFVDWTEGGATVSTSPSYAFTATADRTLVARFSAQGPQQYTVTVSADPAAGGTASGGVTANSGAVVTVTATANAFYAFVNWTEGGTPVSTSPAYSFAVSGDRALVAHFAPVGQDPRLISVSADPVQGGSVSGGGWVGYGEAVTVTATASTGYAFVDWREGGTPVSTSPAYSFPATADRTLVAHFSAQGPQQYTVALSADPAAGGAVSGGGAVNFGAVITVTASANAGYAFVDWAEGGATVSTSPAYRFTVTGNRSLVARFNALPQPVTVAVSASPAEGGSVSGGGVVNSGAVVTVTATAKAGYAFTHWMEGGAAVSSSASYSFTAMANRSLVAHFSPLAPAPIWITVSADPPAGGLAGGGGWVNSGEMVTATATANVGYLFEGWTEGGATVSTSPVYRFTATADRALVARFSAQGPQQYTVTVSADPAAGGVVGGGVTANSGSVVTVTAAANAFYAFTYWTESGVVVSTSPVYGFAVNRDRTLVAHFAPVAQDPRLIVVLADPVQGGSVSGGGWVSYGAAVTVMATASPLYTFVNWTEDEVVVSTNPAYGFAATADRTLVAHFSAQGPQQYTVALSADPAAGGAVSGGGAVNFGAVITVTAAANAGYTFVDWTEGGATVSTSPAYRFTATGDRTLVARFSALPQPVTVAVSADPTAGGSVSGGVTVSSGAVVTVTAAAKAGYAFTHWTEGGAAVSVSAVYSFAATADRSLVAHFSPVAPAPVQVTVSADPLAGGVVGGGGWVNSGALITVTAAANAGYAFVDWTEGGATVSTNPAYRFTATADRSLTARFRAQGPQQYTITLGADPAAGGQVSGGGVVNSGSVVTATAAASAGYVFENWTEGGAVVSTAASYPFAAAADRQLVAHFTPLRPEQHTIALYASPSAGGAVSGGGVFEEGAAVTATAAPSALYSFTHWMEDGVVVSTESSFSFTATADRTLVASFRPQGPETRTVSLGAEPAAGGAVHGGGAVNYGDAITVVAVAKPGYAFSHWSEYGVALMARASYSFVVIADRGLTAHFVLLPQAVNDAFGAATGGYHFFNVKANDRDPAGGGLTVVAVSAPAHGLAVVDPNGGVGYTPAAGYNGLDAFTYTVADARGNRDSAQVTALVGDAAAGHGMPLVHPVTDPAAGATAVFQAPSASVQVQLPGGFFTGTLGARDSLYIVFTPRLAPSAQAGQPPATLRFGGLEFDLSVLYNDQPLAAEQFAQPVTLRITYDAALLDGLKAESLHLRYWTGSEWSDEGVTVASHDLAAHTIVLVLPHLSQYALFAEEGGMTAGLYLPFVER